MGGLQGAGRSWRAIGVDVGASKIAAAIVDQDGRDLGTSRARTAASTASELLDAIVGVALDAARDAGLPATVEDLWQAVRAVGVGLPAQIERDGTIPHCTNLPYIVGSDIVASLKDAFGVPVGVENDANLAAFGEAVLGEEPTDSLVLLTLGTGVGGGIVCDGRLYSGVHGSAGELGHMVALVGGPVCPCGQRGCIEALVAGPSVAERARFEMAEPAGADSSLWALDGAPEAVTAERVAAAARESDPLASRIMRETAEYLGAALSTLANVFAPRRIAIGGGFGEGAGDLLLPVARWIVERDALAGSRRGLAIGPASLGQRAGLIGAALWGVQTADGQAADMKV